MFMNATITLDRSIDGSVGTCTLAVVEPATGVWMRAEAVAWVSLGE